MKQCRTCGKTESDHEQARIPSAMESAIVWYRCPVHGDFCEKCVSSEALVAKPICKMCGKKLVSKRWF